MQETGYSVLNRTYRGRLLSFFSAYFYYKTFQYIEYKFSDKLKSMIKNILPLIIAMIISFLMTPIVRKLAFSIGAIDIPKDSRRVHKKPMPLLGGLAIYISVMVCLFIFVTITKKIMLIIIGGSLILISGIIDDWKGLSPRAKITFQIIAAIILLIGGVRIDFITNPFTEYKSLIYLRYLSIPATIFWLVGITNTLNLIDGLDGLAAGIGAISSLCLMVVARGFAYDQIVILSTIVAGACLGFLPYNFNPAKIFMGDTGSLFLGFMLGAISIEGVMKSVATIAIVVPIIILSIPIFDTSFAIFRRIKNRQSISTGDRGHLHHLLLNRAYSQKKIVLILYVISIIFGIFAILIAVLNTRQGVYISMLVFVIVFVYGLRVGMPGNINGEEDKG